MLLSDNPFLIPDENKLSGAAEVVVRPEVTWSIDPTTTLDFTAETGFRQYHRRYSNFVTGLADLQLRHRRNEYLTISGRAIYRRELLADSLADSSDFAIDARSISESFDVRSSLAWSPNALTTITGDGGWRKLRYPGSTLLETTNAYDAGVSATRRLSERTTAGVRAHATTSRTSGGDKSSIKSLNLTASHRLAQHWQGDIQIGVEWSKLADPVAGGRESRARLNGAAALCYEGGRQTACLRGALRSEVSGFGGLQREVSIGGTYRRQLSEHGVVDIEADYRRARLPGYGAAARVMRVSANYERRVGRNLYFTPGIAYLQRDRLAGEKADAFIIKVGLTIRGDQR